MKVGAAKASLGNLLAQPPNSALQPTSLPRGLRPAARRRGASVPGSTALMIILALVLAVLVGPSTAEAQPKGRLPRVGMIWEGSTTTGSTAKTAFRQGLHELGYTEGKDIVVEHRHAAGRPDQIPKLAAELIALGVDVLVVGGTVSAQSTKAVT